MKYLNRSR